MVLVEETPGLACTSFRQSLHNSFFAAAAAADSMDCVFTGSIPDVADTLNLRKTPHLPPKTQTPRHTNIGGSPVRLSSVRPGSTRRSPVRPLSAQPTDRANRMLDFASAQSPVRATVEKSPSPFKPQTGNGKSAKVEKTRKSMFFFDDSPVKRSANHARSNSEDYNKTVQEAEDVVNSIVNAASHFLPEHQALSHPHVDDYVSLSTEASYIDATSPQLDPETRHSPSAPLVNETLASISVDIDANGSPSINHTSSNQKRKRELPRPSEASPSTSNLEPEHKRRRSRADDSRSDLDEDTSIANDDILDQTAADQTGLDYTVAGETVVEHTAADETELYSATHHSAPKSASRKKAFTVQRDEDHAEDSAEQQQQEEEEDEDDASSVEDFIPPQDTEYERDEDVQEPQPQPQKRQRVKSRKSDQPRGRGRAPAAARNSTAPIRVSRDSEQPARDSESAETEGGTRRKGPKSIVELRAGTPMEDEGATLTRSGRTSIKPLKYWCNETYIWRNGEVDGLVRASEVDTKKPPPPPKRGRTKKRAGLGAIKEDEEDEDEDLLPEAWEEELGVINGRVRTWDPEMGVGNPDEEIHEGTYPLLQTSSKIHLLIACADVAFASTSIATRDVQGSAFRYAKVMTMPFFGAGMVEIPPEGYKRTKNSRKMQMIFFVHEGKVTVEVADIKFGMSKGGVWQVPRGTSKLIFFFPS